MDKHLDFSKISKNDLEHLSHCDFCIEQLADHIEEQGLLFAPANLKEAILSRSQKADVQLIARTNQTSHRLQLFYYSLKVCFATAFALAFLLCSSDNFFSVPSFPTAQEHHLNPGDWRKAEEKAGIKGKLEQFSNQFFQTEVTSYDK